MQSKITKTKDQDVKTLILKAIFICIELCVVPKVEIINQIRKKLSFFFNDTATTEIYTE